MTDVSGNQPFDSTTADGLTTSAQLTAEVAQGVDELSAAIQSQIGGVTWTGPQADSFSAGIGEVLGQLASASAQFKDAAAEFQASAQVAAEQSAAMPATSASGYTTDGYATGDYVEY